MIPKKFYGIVMSCLAAIIISIPIAFIMVAIYFQSIIREFAITK